MQDFSQSWHLVVPGVLLPSVVECSVEEDASLV